MISALEGINESSRQIWVPYAAVCVPVCTTRTPPHSRSHAALGLVSVRLLPRSTICLPVMIIWMGVSNCHKGTAFSDLRRYLWNLGGVGTAMWQQLPDVASVCLFLSLSVDPITVHHFQTWYSITIGVVDISNTNVDITIIKFICCVRLQLEDLSPQSSMCVRNHLISLVFLPSLTKLPYFCHIYTVGLTV